MGNFVGTITTRATAGPLAVGPDPGDSVLFAVLAQRGPADLPQLVTSFDRYTAIFGGAAPFASGTRYSPGYEVVKRFFEKGRTNKRCWITRIVGANGIEAYETLMDRAGSPLATVRATAKGPGTWANSYYLVVANGTNSNTWKLSIYDGNPASTGVLKETWDNLAVTDASLLKVTNGSDYIKLTNLNSATASPNNRPATGTFLIDTVAGVDDNAPAAAFIVGTESGGVKTGLKSFKETRFGRGFLMAPDLDTDSTVRAELLAQSDDYYRSVLFGSQAGHTPAQAISDVANVRQFNAGFHYPRCKVTDDLTGELKTIPAMGHIAADWLTAIQEQGPGKAPAGRDFKVDRITSLEAQASGQPLVDSAVAELLVASGVNPIWDKDGNGPKVWGARTTDSDPAWQYLHAAYTWMVIASRAQAALDQLVYDNATPAFFKQVRSGLYALLCDLHGKGAFSGSIPLENEGEDPTKHAFGVRCDESLLSSLDKQNGNIRAKIWFLAAQAAETIYLEVAKRNPA